MHIIRTISLLSCFAFSFIFPANELSAQTIGHVDSLKGYFNFRLGASKSSLLKYVKPDADTVDMLGRTIKRSYVVDTSLDRRYTKAFGGDISEIQLYFDNDDKLNNITMFFVDVPTSDEPQFLKRFNRIYNFIKKQFGKHTDQIKGTIGSVYSWDGEEIEVRYVVAQGDYEPVYTYQVQIRKMRD